MLIYADWGSENGGFRWIKPEFMAIVEGTYVSEYGKWWYYIPWDLGYAILIYSQTNPFEVTTIDNDWYWLRFDAFHWNIGGATFSDTAISMQCVTDGICPRHFPPTTNSAGYKAMAVALWWSCNMAVSWNGGTPYHHPFIDGIFHETNHPFIGVRPWRAGNPEHLPLTGAAILHPRDSGRWNFLRIHARDLEEYASCLFQVKGHRYCIQ